MRRCTTPAGSSGLDDRRLAADVARAVEARADQRADRVPASAGRAGTGRDVHRDAVGRVDVLAPRADGAPGRGRPLGVRRATPTGVPSTSITTYERNGALRSVQPR